MARSSEKAMAMLNRWTQIKKTIVTGVRGRRPRDVTEAETVRESESWRNQVVHEITRKVSEIQNASLGEHRIRDLNDEINNLLREKSRWEDRVKELGGPDYKASAPRVLDAFGMPLIGDGSYKYFGAAKDLPGIRELFEAEAAAHAAPKKTRAQLYRNITPDYYGWRDEEDGELLLIEQAKESELRRKAIESQQGEHQGVGLTDGVDSSTSLESMLLLSAETVAQSSDVKYDEADSTSSHRRQSDVELLLSGGAGLRNGIGSEGFVAVPSAADIEEMMIEMKKKELLEKYLGGAALSKENVVEI